MLLEIGQFFPLIIIFFYGAIMGSFLNVCIYRIPKYQSIALERSHCPHCNKLIAGWDNIPLISYILLGGKCRNCKDKISGQYFFIELLTAIMFLAFYMKFGISWDLLRGLVIGCTMIIIFFIDLKYLLIFDRLTFSGVISGLLFSTFLGNPEVKESVLGIIIGYVFFVIIFWFGILLLFFSDFFKELRLMIESMKISDINIKNYLRELLKWILKNWDIICLPFFLTCIIGFCLLVVKLFTNFINQNMLSQWQIPFWLFFSFLTIAFLMSIIRDISKEESYHEYIRISNQVKPQLFGITTGITGIAAGYVFWEEDEDLPPIGGGDAKFGALLGAYLGWQNALLSFALSIIVGAIIGIIVCPIRYFQGKYRFGKTAIPFGPAMILGVFLVIFYKDYMIELYNYFMDWYIFSIYGF